MEQLKIVECPRDAMQGIDKFIPTPIKIKYINQLLRVGFDTIDFGSFVSPKVIPQMRDTAEVLTSLELSNTNSKLLSIVVNERGANDASSFEEIFYLGYPFSISETFQQRNTNASIEKSLIRLDNIRNITHKSNKELVVYLSMGFGNHYGDPWNTDILINWIEKLNSKLGISIFAVSDTVGVATPALISKVLNQVLPEFEQIEIGVHLHTTIDTAHEKVKAAYEAGCRRFDGALRGYGGCPMAEDELVGNMPTEIMIKWFEDNKIKTNIDQGALKEAFAQTYTVF